MYMIVKCRKAVVNYTERVLFKAAEYAKVTVANKAFFLLWLSLVFFREKEEMAEVQKENKF